MNPIRMALGILLAALVAAPARPQGESAPPANQTTPPATQTDQQPPPASDSKVPVRHVGGRFEQATLIHQVNPAYPKDAKAAHISGTVVLNGVITKDGTLRDVEYVSGPEELKQAALDAVKQWKYLPATLAGNPVEIDTKIEVVFSLDKPPADQALPAAPEISSGSNAPAAPIITTPVGGLKSADISLTQPPPRALRIRIGGSVQSANLIHRVEPVYPPEVKSVGISGTVILRILVLTDGSVEQADFVSGPQELMAPAIDAVKQWRYRPTKLNGDPVEVDTTVTVVFSL